MSSYLSKYRQLDEDHYRLLKKEASRIAPAAVGAYIRWGDRINRSQRQGTHIDLSLKSFDSWSHQGHLAATPMLSSMTSPYHDESWRTIASGPILINDFDTFWDYYTQYCTTTFNAQCSTPFRYRVKEMRKDSMEGLFYTNPSRKNLRDLIPQGSGIQECIGLALHDLGKPEIGQGIHTYDALSPRPPPATAASTIIDRHTTAKSPPPLRRIAK